MSESSRVIVVGAGPVGLLTALGLARHGLEVTVLDSAPPLGRAPRAAVSAALSMSCTAPSTARCTPRALSFAGDGTSAPASWRCSSQAKLRAMPSGVRTSWLKPDEVEGRGNVES